MRTAESVEYTQEHEQFQRDSLCLLQGGKMYLSSAIANPAPVAATKQAPSPVGKADMVEEAMLGISASTDHPPPCGCTAASATTIVHWIGRS